jgi:hypothetical protein
MVEGLTLMILDSYSSLKVPKHENFILVDFRDFFTKQTPWDSDQVDMIKKIICNGQAL